MAIRAAGIYETMAEDDIHRFTYDDDLVSHHVIEAIAWTMDVDPTDLDPLSDFVDPDALDGLFKWSTSEVVVTFPAYGYAVEVHGDGEIYIQPDS